MIFREGRLPHDLEYEVMINLDNMTITFQRPRGGEGFLAGLLRRLSTVSYVTWPYESMFTNWKWFWKDNGNVWQTYDKDCSVSLKYFDDSPAQKKSPPPTYPILWQKNLRIMSPDKSG